MCAAIAGRCIVPEYAERDHLKDHHLAQFYGNLFESEARHYMTYVALAKQRGDSETIKERLRQLALCEGEIVAESDGLPRLHS